ncbi:MAG: polyisoprenoid-binding protein, partial [Bacteroidetes bacterium HGW-Bacteroidetes-22]
MNHKIKLFFFVGFILAALVACGPQGEKSAAGEAMTEGQTTGVAYNADLTTSVINWEGTKPGGSHYGTIRLKQGNLSVDDNEVTGGEFVIDMKSIVNIDLTDTAYNAKLIGHLMSPDFFAVDSFPTARFKITSVSKLQNPVKDADGVGYTHAITGNLTIKDVTKSIKFDAAISVSDGKVVASTGKFVIDRSAWNIKYGSRKFFDNLKDKFIYDEIG